jgi:hypothetical protein
MSWNSNEEMEKALRAALVRQAAPPDFAARVQAATRPPAKSWPRRPFTLALAAALAALAIVPAVVVDYQHREEARGLKAKQDVLTALTITRDRLQRARDEVRRNTRNTQ